MAQATKQDVSARHSAIKLATFELHDYDSLRYDYVQIHIQDRQRVQDLALEIKRRDKRASEDIIAIGEQLIIAKKLLEHGRFMDWVETEFGYSQSSANEFMNIARRFGSNSQTFVNLGMTNMRRLAAPSVPDEAIEDAIQKAEEKGAPLSIAETKHIIELHKAPLLELEPLPRAGKVFGAWAASKRRKNMSKAAAQHQNMSKEAAQHQKPKMITVMATAPPAQPEPPASESPDMTLDQAIAFVWQQIKQHISSPDDGPRLAWLNMQSRQSWIKQTSASWGVLEAAIARVQANLEGSIEHAKRTEQKQAQQPTPTAESIVHPDWIAQMLAHAAPANADFASALRLASRDQLREAMSNLSTADLRFSPPREEDGQVVSSGENLKDRYHEEKQARLQERLKDLALEVASAAIHPPAPQVAPTRGAEASPPVPSRPALEVTGLEVLPAQPPMPDDLAAAGFRLVSAGVDKWAWQTDANGGYETQGNWLATPADAIEEARAEVEARSDHESDLRDEEQVAIAEVQAFDQFETWLALAPREPDLRQIAAILDYAKHMAQRARTVELALNLHVTNVLPPMSQLINAIEKKVKHG